MILNSSDLLLSPENTRDCFGCNNDGQLLLTFTIRWAEMLNVLQYTGLTENCPAPNANSV